MPSRLSASKLLELTKMRPFDHPAVFGRDGSNSYYDFLARVVEAMGSPSVLELGTCTGGSTAYLAAAGAARVISVDVEQRSTAKEALAPLDNVELWQRDTWDASLIHDLAAVGPFDILFIDTHHTPEQAGFELERYGPLVQPEGVILLDDVRMDGAMTSWWEGLDREKLDLPGLHWSGFGVLFPTSA